MDLNKIKKEEIYRIPDGYFEQLPQQIIQTIHKRKSKKRNLWISSVAAVLVLILCCTGVVNYMNNIKETKQKLAERQKIEEEQLKNQMIDYYRSELAQTDYFYY